jgi:hypothetical protein
MTLQKRDSTDLKSRQQKIIPHLWFDKEAKEAAEF